ESADKLSRQSSATSPAFGDVRINTDSESERFRQQYADVGVFPDDKYVVVWEDDRNGDFDIYAQIFAADDQPLGGNVQLVADTYFVDQRMPSCDIDVGGNLVVAWVDEDGNLYGRIFDEGLNPITDKFKVNDNPGENLCNLPDVAFLSGSVVGFVWEDSRETQNIYCQLYDDFYEPINSNFQINTSIPNSSFWSPQIISGGGSGFAVSWDALTSSGVGILMRVYANDGIPISGLISLPDPASGTHDRFQTSLSHLDETGYAALWIDTRDGGQVVYGQIIDYSGNKNGSNFAICDNLDYVSWDVSSAESGNGSLLVVWASYGPRAEILGTRLTAQGDRDGSNITISDPALFLDRFYPKADIGDNDLPVVVWTDLRDAEHDT
ncbi:MAG: hypothetical protein KAT85_01430, partial [candidate division Zixibacteria bacterium]|nr:hypothetical protein [candidate division Zixibacteria bacterium]